MLIAAPPIDVHHIDMNAKRRAEMRAYSKRHYGYASFKLRVRKKGRVTFRASKPGYQTAGLVVVVK